MTQEEMKHIDPPGNHTISHLCEAWKLSMRYQVKPSTFAWVVSVMLPPMAIFFPLFTLLEDLGYLPRAAFNMDCAFKKCKACGKQCLTMCLVNAGI